MYILINLAILVVVSQVAFTRESESLPIEYHGVWQITAASNNGAKLTTTEDPDGSIGECEFCEIIICENRAILVKNDGRSIVGRTHALHRDPMLKIEFTGIGYHSKQDGPSYFLSKRFGNNSLQLAFAERDSQVIDSSLGGQQYVLTASKSSTK